MDKLKMLVKDILMVALYSVVVSVALIILIGIIALIANGLDYLAIVNFIRSGMLVVGSLTMLLSAFILLMKKENASKLNKLKFKDRFNLINYFGILITFSVIVIIFAIIFDMLLYV